MGEPLIEFQDVTLGYGPKRVLSGLNFAIEQGDFLGLVGPNGAGKTTLLRAVLGGLRPQRGRVVLHHRGAPLRFGYVPQRQEVDESFPLSAGEVVLMGRYGLLGPWRKPAPADREAARRCLDQVGIADLAARPYRDLSGGQKQRTLIARALCGDPTVLVLDEPTNDMDPASERAVMDLVKRLHGERQTTTIVVSHLLNVVCNYVERIAFVDDVEFRIAPLADVLSSDELTRLYGTPVQVGELNGRKVVV